MDGWDVDRRLPRLATAGVLAFSVLLPAIELGRIELLSPASDFWVAVVATACFLPLHLRHMHAALHGQRATGAGWTLALMALVMGMAGSLIGGPWALMLASLAVSILVVVHAPWSIGLIAAVLGAAYVLGSEPYVTADSALPGGLYLALSVVFRALTLFVMVWLVASVRQLDAARALLARQAVMGERAQIEGELRRSLGVALEDVAAQAQQARVLLAAGSPAAEPALRRLVGASRAALADARQIASRYRAAPAREDAGEVAALLRSIGGDTPTALDGVAGSGDQHPGATR